MSFDPVDVWGGTFGSIVKRVGLFASALWLGSVIGVLAVIAEWLVAGRLVGPSMLQAVFLAPLALLNGWAAFNFLVGVGGLAYFVRAEDPGYRAWMILAGLYALGVKLGESFDASSRWLPALIGWTVWAVLVAMLGTGIWLLQQYFTTRWARHLANVRIESTVRVVEREEIVRERLVETRPPEPPPGVIVDLKH